MFANPGSHFDWMQHNCNKANARLTKWLGNQNPARGYYRRRWRCLPSPWRADGAMT
jgi:hypothetical protein